MTNARIEEVPVTGPRQCEVCDESITRSTRCTNGRCLPCHRAHCTPGGVTSPGHARRWPEGTKDCAKCGYGKIPKPALAPGEDELCAKCVGYLAYMREVDEDATDDALEAEALEAACPVCDARPGAPCVNHRSDMGPREPHGLRLVNARGGA